MSKSYLATKEELEVLMTSVNNAILAAQTALNAANDAVDKTNEAMPKSGGTFTGTIVLANGTDIKFGSEDSDLGLKEMLITLLQNLDTFIQAIQAVGNAAMPKSGGNFIGSVGYDTDDNLTLKNTSYSFRNIAVFEGDTAVPSGNIKMIRK